MSDFKSESAIGDARKYASLATFDIEALPAESIERQALQNLLHAVDSLINAVDTSE